MVVGVIGHHGVNAVGPVEVERLQELGPVQILHQRITVHYAAGQQENQNSVLF